jgi:hypothetical protein
MFSDDALNGTRHLVRTTAGACRNDNLDRAGRFPRSRSWCESKSTKSKSKTGYLDRQSRHSISPWISFSAAQRRLDKRSSHSSQSGILSLLMANCVRRHPRCRPCCLGAARWKEGKWTGEPGLRGAVRSTSPERGIAISERERLLAGDPDVSSVTWATRAAAAGTVSAISPLPSAPFS